MDIELLDRLALVYYTGQLLTFAPRKGLCPRKWGSHPAEFTDSEEGCSTAATVLMNTETTPCSATPSETQHCTLEQSLCQLAAHTPKADTEKQNYPVVLFLKSHCNKAVKGEHVSSSMYLKLRLQVTT